MPDATDFNKMRNIAASICDVVEVKDRDYGSSWRRRGGAGAFFVMSRKWDRIENLVKQHGWDIFAALAADTGGIADDVDDLIGYLLLIREHCMAQATETVEVQPRMPELIHSTSTQYSAPLPADALFQPEGITGNGLIMYKCRACRADVRAMSLAQAHQDHAQCSGPPQGQGKPSGAS